MKSNELYSLAFTVHEPFKLIHDYDNIRTKSLLQNKVEVFSKPGITLQVHKQKGDWVTRRWLFTSFRKVEQTG